jgi:hypothetical protein
LFDFVFFTGDYILAGFGSSKRNSAVKNAHKDLHFIRSQIAYVQELSEMHTSECITFSNMVNVGTLALSRYHQISRFFPENDAPDYFDHDFPYANCKIFVFSKEN